MKMKLEKFEARNAAERTSVFDAARRADVDAAMIPASRFHRRQCEAGGGPSRRDMRVTR
jgi:hypothetical protein